MRAIHWPICKLCGADIAKAKQTYREHINSHGYHAKRSDYRYYFTKEIYYDHPRV